MPPRIPKNYFGSRSYDNQAPTEFEQTYDRLRSSNNVEDVRKKIDPSYAGEQVGKIIGHQKWQEDTLRDMYNESIRPAPRQSDITLTDKDKADLENIVKNHKWDLPAAPPRPTYNHAETLKDIGTAYDNSLREMSYKVPKK